MCAQMIIECLRILPSAIITVLFCYDCVTIALLMVVLLLLLLLIIMLSLLLILRYCGCDFDFVYISAPMLFHRIKSYQNNMELFLIQYHMYSSYLMRPYNFITHRFRDFIDNNKWKISVCACFSLLCTHLQIVT